MGDFTSRTGRYAKALRHDPIRPLVRIWVVRPVELVNGDRLRVYEILEDACKRIPNGIGIQGNVDPGILFGNKESIKERIDNTFNKVGDRKYILNLGHGILPGTPEENAQTFFEHGKKLTY